MQRKREGRGRGGGGDVVNWRSSEMRARSLLRASALIADCSAEMMLLLMLPLKELMNRSYLQHRRHHHTLLHRNSIVIRGSTASSRRRASRC